ncbi:unnamed protein product [Symbiodinium sp. CCMP2592]|nr:unnamed protein product [Symbiodinium sp. CCMP2592]
MASFGRKPWPVGRVYRHPIPVGRVPALGEDKTSSDLAALGLLSPSHLQLDALAADPRGRQPAPNHAIDSNRDAVLSKQEFKSHFDTEVAEQSAATAAATTEVSEVVSFAEMRATPTMVQTPWAKSAPSGAETENLVLHLAPDEEPADVTNALQAATAGAASSVAGCVEGAVDTAAAQESDGSRKAQQAGADEGSSGAVDLTPFDAPLQDLTRKQKQKLKKKLRRRTKGQKLMAEPGCTNEAEAHLSDHFGFILGRLVVPFLNARGLPRLRGCCTELSDLVVQYVMSEADDEEAKMASRLLKPTSPDFSKAWVAEQKKRKRMLYERAIKAELQLFPGTERVRKVEAAVSCAARFKMMRPMVALEEVGPAADFGSLCLGCHGSAFLGVGVPGVPVAERGAHLKAPLPLPTPTATSARIGKDGTLSKKVAFRMLKQLGCEVLSDEDGEARYVQVGIKTQPVLFKMLVELGHAPRRGEDGEFMVQVVEQRGRKPEEVVAALSAPRKPPRAPRQEPEDEGYPSMPRPRLKPEDAQLLVNRLYKVPRRPPAEVKADAAKPRRTAAEQRAYLDRLVKPRAEETQAPELDEVILEAGRRLLKNGITWPSFSSPSESRAKKAQSRTRLAQAGALAISSTEPKDVRGPQSMHSRLRLPRSRPSSAELRRRDSGVAPPLQTLQPLQPLQALEALESVLPKSPPPESPPPPAEQEVSAGGLEQEETPIWPTAKYAALRQITPQ